MYFYKYINAVQKNSESKAKPSHLKYLYEIAAIPFEIRKEYFKKISNRFNYISQKNISLLMIIYWHLEMNRKLLWNDDKICETLGISKKMLYCHKSRLLKRLREYYFRWKEIEEKEFGNMEEGLEKEFEKAKRMFDIGMEDEAKNLFVKIKKNLKYHRQKNFKLKFLYFETCKYLCEYYFRHMNKDKLFEAYNELNVTGKKLKRCEYAKKNIEAASTISIFMNECKSFTLRLHSHNSVDNKNFRMSIKLAELSLEESRKINNARLEISILKSLIFIYSFMQNFDKVKNIAEKGMCLCKKNKDKIHYELFKSYKVFINVYSSGEINKMDIEEIYKCYLNIKDDPGNTGTKLTILLNNIYLTSMYNDSFFLLRSFKEYNSLSLLSRGFKRSLRWMLFMKFSYYASNIYNFKAAISHDANKSYLYVEGINKECYSEYQMTMKEFQLFFGKIKNIYFKKEALLFMLYNEFWKGKNCSRDYTDYLISRIEYINKTRPEIKKINQNRIDQLNLMISILNDSSFISSSDLLTKHENKLNASINELKSSCKNFNEIDILCYLMLSFLAKETGCYTLQKRVRDLYFYIIKKQPRAFDFIKNRKTLSKKESSQRNENVLIDSLEAA